MATNAFLIVSWYACIDLLIHCNRLRTCLERFQAQIAREKRAFNLSPIIGRSYPIVMRMCK